MLIHVSYYLYLIPEKVTPYSKNTNITQNKIIYSRLHGTVQDTVIINVASAHAQLDNNIAAIPELLISSVLRPNSPEKMCNLLYTSTE
jgi:hypothetical protein